MPNISDRIGNQNVIRVLSNIGASATRLVDLSDVDVSSLVDGFVLEYKASTSKFITTDSFRFLKNVNVTGITTSSTKASAREMALPVMMDVDAELAKYKNILIK